MALSDKQIVQLSLEWPAETNDWASHIDFARAIEAEVHKQDTELIRQLVEALDTAFHQTCSVGRPKDWEQIRNALHSARARLEGTP